MIYFIITECGNIVKIGYSTDVDKRFETIQTISPLPVRVAAKCQGGFRTEANLHRHFSKQNNHHEWFFVDEEIECLIKYVNDNGNLPDEFIEAEDLHIQRISVNKNVICSDYVSGKNISYIARAHGTTREKVRRILSENSIKLRKAPKIDKSQWRNLSAWQATYDDGDIDICIEPY